MKKVTITTTQTTPHDVELIYPCFMVDKDGRSMIAVIDELNVIKTYRSDDNSYMLATKGTLDFFKSDVVNAHNNWHSVTETDFFEELSSIQRLTALEPVLTEKIVA